jgi:hypothetical protein
LYTDLSLKLRLDEGETRSMETGRGVRQGCCLISISFNIYSEYLISSVLEEFGDHKLGGKVFRTRKYGNDLVLLYKK